MTSSRIRPSTTSVSRARAARAATPGSSAAGSVWSVGAAALEVERRDPVDEHDVRARRALERPPVRLAAPRPGQRGAVRVGRVGRGQEVDRTRRGDVGRFADRAQPVEGARQRELRRPEPVDEVAAPDAAGLLHRPQDRVDGGEPAVDALGGDRLAGQDAVALEEGQAQGVEPLGRPGDGSGVRRDERPAAGGLGRSEAVSRPGRPTVRRAPLPVRFQRRARSGANVSLVTSPAQTRSHSASRTSRSEFPRAAVKSSR